MHLYMNLLVEYLWHSVLVPKIGSETIFVNRSLKKLLTSKYFFNNHNNFQIRQLIDEAIVKNEQALVVAEKARSAALREVGNHLHESVPVDDDEDHNKVERTHGDCTFRTKYSHVDLICMIDGEFYLFPTRLDWNAHWFLIRFVFVNTSKLF